MVDIRMVIVIMKVCFFLNVVNKKFKNSVGNRKFRVVCKNWGKWLIWFVNILFRKEFVVYVS